MDNRKIVFSPIGVIHSPYKKPKDMPIQPVGAKSIEGTVEVFPEYEPGLKDLEGFSHVYLLYFFHLSEGYSLEVVPYLDTEIRGLFSTRAPKRPNQLGLSVVRLERIEGRILHISGVDMVDGTPLLDIKPYVPGFELREDVRVGWLSRFGGEATERKSDDRFCN